MTFAIYIRLVQENYQNLVLSSISEVYKFGISEKNRQVSLSIAYLFLISCIVFYFFIIYQFQTTRVWIRRKEYAYSEELFAGLKQSNKARSFTVALITRRLLLGLFLLCLQDLQFIICVIIFGIIQILFFVMIL